MSNSCYFYSRNSEPKSSCQMFINYPIKPHQIPPNWLSSNWILIVLGDIINNFQQEFCCLIPWNKPILNWLLLFTSCMLSTPNTNVQTVWQKGFSKEKLIWSSEFTIISCYINVIWVLYSLKSGLMLTISGFLYDHIFPNSKHNTLNPGLAKEESLDGCINKFKPHKYGEPMLFSTDAPLTKMLVVENRVVWASLEECKS